MFDLVSADMRASRYVEINCQFKETEVELYAIKNLRPMVGDVTVGPYSFSGNVLKLPRIGSFKTKQTEDGFDLYVNGKLKYRLSKKNQPFIQPEATAPQRQSLSALVVN